jgi:hypothetical protein
MLATRNAIVSDEEPILVNRLIRHHTLDELRAHLRLECLDALLDVRKRVDTSRCARSHFREVLADWNVGRVSASRILEVRRVQKYSASRRKWSKRPDVFERSDDNLI